MAIEIEHKFLLANESWRAHVEHAAVYRQGYLSAAADASIRVRVSGEKAWLNIKTAVTGSHRHEYEYEIPLVDAEEILHRLCRKPLVEKNRHFVRVDGFTWEIDEFFGANQGLVVAEIELTHIGQSFPRPAWLGVEVTDDVRYYNNNLAAYPYTAWGEIEPASQD